ncbi:class I SAM-dependent methyltransferase [Aquibium microcysteis]|uniref:class I SAM-dependent methyltransferase n=1 Tax=Aquibium microcysteis TaxID=675281 RepID=UPI00165CF0D4|nr:class I SAM-dependent methyltransferase [Aquibium microcysteis]
MDASDLDHRRHWDEAYVQKGEAGVSWFEETPTVSLYLIKALSGPKDSLIDVGGGASRLAAHALRLRFGHVAVLDLSAEAIARSQAAMGSEADRVEWIVANVTTWKPGRRYDVWHDRAAFHFLTDEADRAAYVETLDAALSDTGHAIIATFALDGPERCSGLPVQRYSPETLAATLGPRFTLVNSMRHEHQTPLGSTQAFKFSVLARVS